jgi:hypothetical protein
LAASTPTSAAAARNTTPTTMSTLGMAAEVAVMPGGEVIAVVAAVEAVAAEAEAAEAEAGVVETVAVAGAVTGVVAVAGAVVVAGVAEAVVERRAIPDRCLCEKIVTIKMSHFAFVCYILLFGTWSTQ